MLFYQNFNKNYLFNQKECHYFDEIYKLPNIRFFLYGVLNIINRFEYEISYYCTFHFSLRFHNSYQSCVYCCTLVKFDSIYVYYYYFFLKNFGFVYVYLIVKHINFMFIFRF